MGKDALGITAAGKQLSAALCREILEEMKMGFIKNMLKMLLNTNNTEWSYLIIKFSSTSR